MGRRQTLLTAGIAAVGLLGIAGARIQARLSAHPDPPESRVAPQAQIPRVERNTFGVEGFARRFDDGGARLEVDVADADVVLESGTGPAVHVRAYVDTSDRAEAVAVLDDVAFVATQRANVTYVETDRHRTSGRRGHGHRDLDVTVVITIPDGTDVRVQTGDGDVRASRLSGDATLRTSDGDVVVESAERGDLDIHTSDGDIVVDRLEGRSARVETSDGDVTLRRVRAPLQVRSGDGDVEVHLVAGNPTSVSTGDGDILLTAPADLAANLRMDGEDIDVEEGVELLGRMRTHSVEGTLNGGGPIVELRTGDGEISLRRGR